MCGFNVRPYLVELQSFMWVVGSGDGAGKLLVPGRPATLAYSRAGPVVFAAGEGQAGCFLIFSSRLSYLPFLMPRLLGDGWTF